MYGIERTAVALRVRMREWGRVSEERRKDELESFVESTSSYHGQGMLAHIGKMGACELPLDGENMVERLIGGARPWLPMMQLDNPIIGGWGPRFRRERFGEEEDREEKIVALTSEEFVEQFERDVIGGFEGRMKHVKDDCGCTAYGHGKAMFVEWYFSQNGRVGFDMFGPEDESVGVHLPSFEIFELHESYLWIDILVYPSQIVGNLMDEDSTVKGLRDNPGGWFMQRLRNAGGKKMRIKTVQEPWMACVVKALVMYFERGFVGHDEILTMSHCLSRGYDDLDHAAPPAPPPVEEDWYL